MIPALIFRTVPELVDAQVEAWWERAVELHPGWRMITYRDPLDPHQFPLTAPYWRHCLHGAQLAGLIRLEALFHHGGIYLDSDVEVIRPLDALRRHQAFAAWEDNQTVPDAVLGATRRHPAIGDCIDLALKRITSSSPDWRTGRGAWATGPGVTTTILPTAEGVHLYGPDAFYPVHYTERGRLEGFVPGDDTYAVHHWHASWLG